MPVKMKRTSPSAAVAADRTRLILIDAGPVLKLAEVKLAPYRLSDSELDAYLQAYWGWLRAVGWCPLIADTPERQRNITLVCRDMPPYWRSSIYPGYKGQRSPKSPLYNAIAESMDAHCPSIGVATYEADDIIAYFCRKFKERESASPVQHCYIATVDHDLMGLVADDIIWLGLAHSAVRQRGPSECYDWLASKYPKTAKRRHKYWPLPSPDQFSPSDIWQWKYKVAGDSSDGLKFPSGGHPESETSELYQGLVDLHKPATPLDLPADSVRQTVEEAKAYKPEHHYRELEDFVLNEFGIPFPLSPIAIAPPSR